MRKSLAAVAIFIPLLSACSDDDPAPGRLPYDPDKTTVIGGERFYNAKDDPDFKPIEGGAIAVGTPDGSDCAELDVDVCVNPQNDCGDDGTADVLLGKDGAVVDVICYPTGGVAVESFEGPVEDVGNNVVLVVDDAVDGVDVMGDVTIDGNNVTLFGYGPDTSVIGGNLNIDKNNAVVRGVRVQGDVVIDKNNPSLVNCVIEGDLTIKGNNVSVALCDVWGELKIEGNNAILVSNRFAQAPEVEGENLICNDNVAFSDADGDGTVDEAELGAEVTCTDKAEK